MLAVEFGDEFIKQYPNFPSNLQNAILDFITLVQEHGLEKSAWCYYKGKISHSWRNLNPNDPNYHYTFHNQLWHYHIGIPAYRLSRTGLYHTSDMVLHFVWDKTKDYIVVVDCTEHYKANGDFWLPAPQYLTFQKTS